jgi:hypothetical protein
LAGEKNSADQQGQGIINFYSELMNEWFCLYDKDGDPIVYNPVSSGFPGLKHFRFNDCDYLAVLGGMKPTNPLLTVSLNA